MSPGGRCLPAGWEGQMAPLAVERPPAQRRCRTVCREEADGRHVHGRSDVQGPVLPATNRRRWLSPGRTSAAPRRSDRSSRCPHGPAVPPTVRLPSRALPSPRTATRDRPGWSLDDEARVPARDGEVVGRAAAARMHHQPGAAGVEPETGGDPLAHLQQALGVAEVGSCGSTTV